MTKEAQMSKAEWHRKMAAQLFNHTWGLIDKGEKRTLEDNDEMIHSAHASRYHWGEVVAAKTPKTGPMNIERGEWQISRVYSLVKRPEAALYHAKRTLDIVKANKIGDFDLAFAYEAMARAYSLQSEKAEEVKKYLKLAKEAAEQIKKEDDKKYFLSELVTIPGYQE